MALMHTRKLIVDLLTIPQTTGPEEPTFIAPAKLDNIYPHAGWCYVTCRQCSKNVQAMGGLFVCKICDVPCRYPVIRYMIHVCASDYMGGGKPS